MSANCVGEVSLNIPGTFSLRRLDNLSLTITTGCGHLLRQPPSNSFFLIERNNLSENTSNKSVSNVALSDVLCMAGEQEETGEERTEPDLHR